MRKHIMGPRTPRNIGPRYTQEQRENLAHYRQQIRIADREIAENRWNVEAVIRWKALMQQGIRDIQVATRTAR